VYYARLSDILAGRTVESPARKSHVVLMAVSDRRLAVAVDDLLVQEELVVKGFTTGTPRLEFVSGVTTLADGRLVTVLEPSALIQAVTTVRVVSQKSAGKPQATVVVADDSLTSRTMVASALQRAGYQTLLAPDGAAAWALLQKEKVDALVSDVEMPGLDGFNLVRQVREDAKLRSVPCILITSLGSHEDRARGAEVGADGYIVKKDFDPGLLLGMLSELLKAGSPNGN
jgi:two-component system chemotaxis sensor kinase CheA